MIPKTKFLIIILILLLSFTFISGCIKPSTYMIEMRDGIKLATDIYLPKNQNQPHGAILIRTPYNKNGSTLTGINFANAGWPTVIQDTRGRFASEGNDTVFRNSHTDGPDTLKWIADQSWSNGKIATLGGICIRFDSILYGWC